MRVDSATSVLTLSESQLLKAACTFQFLEKLKPKFRSPEEYCTSYVCYLKKKDNRRYLLSLGRCGNLAGTNSPNWLVGNHHIAPVANLV